MLMIRLADFYLSLMVPIRPMHGKTF